MAKRSGADVGNKINSSRSPLSRERVLQAAIVLADRTSLEALSMRKLAEALGVKAMSLYNHVSNRDDLLNGMVDLVVSEIELPEIQPNWQEAMRRRALSAHGMLLQHPWATLLLVSRVNVGPAMLRYINATLGCLVEAGFSLEMADHAWNAMDSHIYGFTLQELNFPFDAEDYSEAAEAYVAMIPAEQYPYMNQLTHRVISGDYDGVHDFEMGLGLILSGLEPLRHSKS